MKTVSAAYVVYFVCRKISCTNLSISSISARKVCADVPYIHLSFAIKLIMRSVVIAPNADSIREPNERDERNSTPFTFEMFNGLIPDIAYSDNRNKTHRPKKKMEVISFIIPLDTLVVNDFNSDKTTSKHLLINCAEKCSAGFTKLRPLKPFCWTPVLSKNGYIIHLKHDKFVIAFKCEWPTMCQEFIERQRQFDWPSRLVLDEIVSKGSWVIPDADAEDECWKITFLAAERILRDQAVLPAQLECFRAVKLMLDEMEASDVIGVDNLIHCFFYMCEETEVCLWNANPGQCVNNFLWRLADQLKEKVFLNFFFKDLNMFDAAVSESSLEKCLKRVLVLCAHPFVCLYMSVEPCLKKILDFERIFDETIDDIKVYQNDISTVEGCLVPLMVDMVELLLYGKDYKGAVDNTLEMMHGCNSFLGQPLLLFDTFFIHILTSMSCNMQRWLLALYIDLREKKRLTGALCVGDENALGLSDVYGKQFEENLLSVGTSSDDIKIPGSLLHFDTICLTTYRLVNVVRSLEMPKDVLYSLFCHCIDNILPSVCQHFPTFEERIKNKVEDSFSLLVCEIILFAKKNADKIEPTNDLLNRCKQLISAYRGTQAERLVEEIESLMSDLTEKQSQS